LLHLPHLLPIFGLLASISHPYLPFRPWLFPKL
jgi:hypothetical protein